MSEWVCERPYASITKGSATAASSSRLLTALRDAREKVAPCRWRGGEGRRKGDAGRTGHEADSRVVTTWLERRRRRRRRRRTGKRRRRREESPRTIQGGFLPRHAVADTTLSSCRPFLPPASLTHPSKGPRQVVPCAQGDDGHGGRGGERGERGEQPASSPVSSCSLQEHRQAGRQAGTQAGR